MAKGYFEGAVFVFNEDGEFETPVESNLAHRFALEDGVIVDKYNGVSDVEVRQIDHEAAAERVAAAQAAWDAAEEKVGLRPADLPELVTAEE